jgi:hypothetical protein
MPNIGSTSRISRSAKRPFMALSCCEANVRFGSERTPLTLPAHVRFGHVPAEKQTFRYRPKVLKKSLPHGPAASPHADGEQYPNRPPSRCVEMSARWPLL